MKRVLSAVACMLVLAITVALAGCSSGASSAASSAASVSAASSAAAASDASQATASSESSTATLEKGTYSVKFDTDSSMFHVNEVDEGRAVLTVDDTGMNVHVRLVSKKITNLYAGTADQAQADEAGVLQPTTDTVTYKDGMTEEVFGFDVPVPSLDEPFDVAILGTKGKWYDHKVTVSDPIAEK